MAIRVGVIGVGRLGGFHAEKYAALESADLVGVYDPDPERAAEVAGRLGTRAFATAAELLAEVEAVSIVAPTQEHHRLGMQALAAGVHTLVEKPITATIDEARELVATARAAGLKLQVGHIERFNPALLAVEGYELAPLFVESHRLAPFSPRGADVAVVLDLMIHDIDLILTLIKSPVTHIQASGVAVVSGSADIANARVEFENGAVANVTASRISAKRMRKMRLFQRDAYLSLDFADGTAEVFRLAADGEATGAVPSLPLGQIERGSRQRTILYEQPPVEAERDALKHELTLFLRAVEQNTEPVVTGEDGLRALEVADRIVKLIEAQTIRFDEG